MKKNLLREYKALAPPDTVIGNDMAYLATGVWFVQMARKRVFAQRVKRGTQFHKLEPPRYVKDCTSTDEAIRTFIDICNAALLDAVPHRPQPLPPRGRPQP